MKKLLITVNGKKYDVEVEVLEDDDESTVQSLFKPSARPVEHYPGANLQVTSSLPTQPKIKQQQQSDSKILTSPINGIVLEVPAKEGQSVNENDILFILEAMKMKTNITSPFSATIKSINAKAGDRIEAGQELLSFE